MLATDADLWITSTFSVADRPQKRRPVCPSVIDQHHLPPWTCLCGAHSLAGAESFCNLPRADEISGELSRRGGEPRSDQGRCRWLNMKTGPDLSGPVFSFQPENAQVCTSRSSATSQRNIPVIASSLGMKPLRLRHGVAYLYRMSSTGNGSGVFHAGREIDATGTHGMCVRSGNSHHSRASICRRLRRSRAVSAVPGYVVCRCRCGRHVSRVDVLEPSRGRLFRPGPHVRQQLFADHPAGGCNGGRGRRFSCWQYALFGL